MTASVSPAAMPAAIAASVCWPLGASCSGQRSCGGSSRRVGDGADPPRRRLATAFDPTCARPRQIPRRDRRSAGQRGQLRRSRCIQPCGSGAVPCWMPSSASRTFIVTAPGSPSATVNEPRACLTAPTGVTTAAVPQANTSVIAAVGAAGLPLLGGDPPLLDARSPGRAPSVEDRVAGDAGQQRAGQRRRDERGRRT